MIFLLHKTGENIYTKSYLVIKNIFNIKRKKGVFRFLHSLASDPFFFLKKFLTAVLEIQDAKIGWNFNTLKIAFY